MTEPKRARRLRNTAAVQTWRGFCFELQPAYPLGLIRMAFGVLAFAWTISLLPDLSALFGSHGIVPRQPGDASYWGVFALFTSDRALLIGWAVLLVASLALTIGWHSRVAALVVFALIMSFQHRDPWVWNSGDVVVRIEALVLALSPCGAALSLDQARRGETFWSAQQRPRWAVRLLQVQMSLIYVASALSKITGTSWPRGTAVSYALRLPDLVLLTPPDWVTNSALLMNAATWGTLVLELCLGLLVWNRRLRPWVLAVGVVMHTVIMATIAVGFFSLAMFVLYLAFIPPETVQRLGNNANRVLGRETAPES